MSKNFSPKVFAADDTFLNALAEAYRLQEAIIHTTELSIISVDTGGVITSFNRAAENMLGYTADEMIGRATPLVFHDTEEIVTRSKELAEELNISIEPAFEVFCVKARLTRIADRREWTYIRKDGTRFPVLLSITALWDDKDQLIGYAGIATDITESKKNAQKIIDSEAHLNALLNSIDDIAVELGRDGTYKNIWTKKEHLLFHSPREQYIGKRIEDVLQGELLAQFKEAINIVFSTRQYVYFEYLVPSGERWSSVKISYISDDKVLMLIRDITEKKTTEITLTQSEDKFRTLAENIPGVVYLCKNDASFSMVYLNNRVEEITGYPMESFLSGELTFVDLYHPDDKAYIFATVEKALAEKKQFHLTYRILHRSGETRWLEEFGVGLYSDTSLLLIEGFVNDITAQREAEDHLQKIADENFRLFNNSITLSVITDFNGYFKKVNPAWESLLGWTEQELTSRPFTDFIHPDDVQATKEANQYITEGNHLYTFENRYRGKDGSYRWLLWGSASDPVNKVAYASAVDITERKKSEEELLRSKKNIEAIALKLQEQNHQLDEFAHIISHNLRSPVGNIKALISFLDENSSVDDYRQIFDKLKNVATNLGETMNELMETLKAKKTADVERVDLYFEDTLKKVLQTLEGDLIQSGAIVTANFDQAPKITYAKAYLESIIQNLISNAIKYRSPYRTPEIHIASNFIDNDVVLTVRDNGLGIDLKKFGEKLFGLHKTFHDHREARGVGLFLVKTQIEALGGSIAAESEVDKGTTFTIIF